MKGLSVINDFLIVCTVSFAIVVWIPVKVLIFVFLVGYLMAVRPVKKVKEN